MLWLDRPFPLTGYIPEFRLLLLRVDDDDDDDNNKRERRGIYTLTLNLLRSFIHRCLAKVSSNKLHLVGASPLSFQSCFSRRSLPCICSLSLASSASFATPRRSGVEHSLAEASPMAQAPNVCCRRIN